jgi:hypothetical protein
MIAALVGLLLAFSVGLLGTASGLDRDRAYYPVIAIVVASYYALFAVMGGSTQALVAETLVGMLFAAAAIAGFRRSLWITAGALAAHGLFDFIHADVLANAGVPPWWPVFCLAFDVGAAGYLGWLLRTGRARAQVA